MTMGRRQTADGSHILDFFSPSIIYIYIYILMVGQLKGYWVVLKMFGNIMIIIMIIMMMW